MSSKLTVGFLIVFSILGLCLTILLVYINLPLFVNTSVSAYEYFGKPINCLVKHKELKQFAENICWINGTFNNRNVSKCKNREKYLGMM